MLVYQRVTTINHVNYASPSILVDNADCDGDSWTKSPGLVDEKTRHSGTTMVSRLDRFDRTFMGKILWLVVTGTIVINRYYPLVN